MNHSPKIVRWNYCITIPLGTMNILLERIILVEDDPIISWQMTRHLHKLGYRVLDVFTDYQEAEIEIYQHRPDLVISNLRLADGWVDAMYLKMIVRNTHKLIICTALSNASMYLDILHKLPISILYKPFAMCQLEKFLENMT